MKYLFFHYPKWSTARKAKSWLDEHEIEYDVRNIVDENPKVEEIKKWIESGVPIKNLFSTNGKAFKEANLKEKLPNMSEEEQIELLASSGMLVKRPILVVENNVLIGFKQGEWEELFSQ